jgi:hypothetical protein
MTSDVKEKSEAALPSAINRQWWGRSAALLLCVLVVCSLIIMRGIHAGEFSYDVDETEHAVTGLYAAALMHDHPTHPIEHTYQFYAQYPAIAVIHWPPLFYGFEGLSFLFAGAERERRPPHHSRLRRLRETSDGDSVEMTTGMET